MFSCFLLSFSDDNVLFCFFAFILFIIYYNHIHLICTTASSSTSTTRMAGGIHNYDYTNEALIYIIPLLSSIYNNTQVAYITNWIRSASYLLTLLCLGPLVILLSADLILYIYRLIVISWLSWGLVPDLNQIRRQRRQKLYHSNSYFDFNNYIKSFHNPHDTRKNSADSLNSSASAINLSSANTAEKDEEGKVYLRNGRDHQQLHQQRSRSVVFSVSN